MRKARNRCVAGSHEFDAHELGRAAQEIDTEVKRWIGGDVNVGFVARCCSAVVALSLQTTFVR